MNSKQALSTRNIALVGAYLRSCTALGTTSRNHPETHEIVLLGQGEIHLQVALNIHPVRCDW